MNTHFHVHCCLITVLNSFLGVAAAAVHCGTPHGQMHHPKSRPMQAATGMLSGATIHFPLPSGCFTLISRLTPCCCCSALWNAARPDASPEAAASAGGHWHAQWGDRCQELVWIGVNMDESALRSMLGACLLTDDEMALGPEGWAAQFEDPLPPWETGQGSDEGEEYEWEEGEDEGEQ
jgi:hypothetical protein